MILTIRFFTEKRVMAEAAALTYSSLLAMVPILAVVFAIARGFGYNKYIEFNQIWQVSNARPIMRSLTNYLAMFLLFPIIIIVSMGLSIVMTTLADKIENFFVLGPVVIKLLDLSPSLLLSVLFIVLYVYMPNTKVKLSCAIVPGILAGLAMHVLQLFYIYAQIWVTGYNAIYGSFAALPLFMLWVQFSWTICLFGAQLTYTNQNLNRIGINLEPMEIHPKIDMSDDERGPEATKIYADNIDSL